MNCTQQTWALTDGHAGNVRQVNALARALGLPTRDWVLQTRAPWKQLAPRLARYSQAAFGPTFTQALKHPPKLALGCGRQAALATRMLHQHGSQVVQILNPRLSTTHWDLVIAPSHDRLHGANVLTLLGSLNPVDDVWLAHARRAFAHLGALPGPRVALLIGGPTAHAPLTLADVEAITACIETYIAQGGHVLVTTSRRTPSAWVARLRQRYGCTRHVLWSGQQDGINPYPGLLAWADCIVCTPDSVNMLSEACATHVPVYVYAAERTRGRLREFVDTLQQRARIAPLSDALTPFAVTPLRETQRIAQQVTLRLALD